MSSMELTCPFSSYLLHIREYQLLLGLTTLAITLMKQSRQFPKQQEQLMLFPRQYPLPATTLLLFISIFAT